MKREASAAATGRDVTGRAVLPPSGRVSSGGSWSESVTATAVNGGQGRSGMA